MKTVLAMLLFQLTQVFAACPTEEFLGGYRAIPKSCGENTMFSLGFVDVIRNGADTQISFFDSNLIWPVVVLNYNANSDQDPNFSYQCLNTQEEKIVYHPFMGTFEASFLLKDGKYSSVFFGCEYELEKLN